MVVDDATWAEIRRLWLETAEPSRLIAQRFKVPHSTIHHRAVREAWPEHPSRAARRRSATLSNGASPLASAGRSNSKPTRRRQPRDPVAPEARARRMLAIIDLQLEQLERDMASSDELTVQDKERLGRSLGTIIGSLEKVMEVNAEHEKQNAARNGPIANDEQETERLRSEIAERLERLNAQWLAQQTPK